ncbi:MAG: hypothetical protein LDLANPLL_00007 [Turneriella sp.]|nr:hypothetical protein [Turneriella sp.]
MKKIALFYLGLLFLAYCSAQPARNPKVVLAEEEARQKPLLNPPGGDYFGAVDIAVLGYNLSLEYSTGGAYQALTSNTIHLATSATVSVRDKNRTDLSTSEAYTISSTFVPLVVEPTPGTYTSAQNVTLRAAQKNVKIEVKIDGIYQPYNTEQGLTASTSQSFVVRQCVDTNCTADVTLNYTINPPPVLPPEPRALTETEIASLVADAGVKYKQTGSSGLAHVLDEAKLLVIDNPSLIANSSLRTRFLAQDNIATADANCTTIARFLYVTARRITLEGRTLPGFPDYPRYFVDQIDKGNLTVDSGGRNFVWVLNGAAMVNPYLPADALSPYEYQRGTTYPTDFSLLDKLVIQNPLVTLLRDGPSASSNTHTFIAVKSASGYTMVDTYFTAFDGIETRASAGLAWPYAYRFGPPGSRYLHFVYGY